ncbi:hypothetical protein HAN_3g380 (nucleomorph) [Hemiselmis andersenii]|uniref:Uncharacterized protein n=1 Tax=Hemiselmis andersenii TaxID=464988 RepID=A9BL07_HEMAN|nr:hypothetical protein HAN_3g380 [Hemiselmis andersenii]ABW98190.1 hypothetical protein HAN_3g380 [Hemiselmis andersenii]|mmetsp:Transcript_37476/g.91080  ORF Transcript_37476/g.91080 Transcript_37476/m.91080 type:complete len:205 (+) Transcript_37476:112-726(+)
MIVKNKKEIIKKKIGVKFLVFYRSFLFQRKNYLFEMEKKRLKNFQGRTLCFKKFFPKSYKKFCFSFFFSLHKISHLILIRKKFKRSSLVLPGGTVKRKEKKNLVINRLIKLNFGNIEINKKKSFFKSNKWVFPEKKINLKYPFPISHNKIKQKTIFSFFLKLTNFENFKIKKNQEMVAIPCYEIHQNFLNYNMLLSSNLPLSMF